MDLPPIIITGCPRSGTQMMARVFGSLSREFYLITEHSDKKNDVPEENSSVEDHRLWWENFQYEAWNTTENRPRIDMPIPSEEGIRQIRDQYTQLAQGRRIVIKNPSHILYPSQVRKVFPDAKFVCCVRNPWHTLQSMIKGGHDRLLLLSSRAADSQKSLLLRAAIGWNDAYVSFQESRDAGWAVAQYEKITDSPQTAIAGLCAKLGISSAENLDIDRAAAIPQASRSNFYFVKNAFLTSSDQTEVTEELRAGCKEFGYSLSPDELFGTPVSYAFERFAAKIKKKIVKTFGRRAA